MVQIIFRKEFKISATDSDWNSITHYSLYDVIVVLKLRQFSESLVQIHRLGIIFKYEVDWNLEHASIQARIHGENKWGNCLPRSGIFLLEILQEGTYIAIVLTNDC